MTAPNISLGDVGVGISRGLRTHESPTLPSTCEISYAVITLGESCNILGSCLLTGSGHERMLKADPEQI